MRSRRDAGFILAYNLRRGPSGPRGVWFFQIILVAITPIVDLLLLASLPFGAWRALLPFVIAFLAMDVLLATLACILERESILHAWRILPMRFIYRPLLSYVVWKALFRAVKGAFVTWGKLERTASVPVRVLRRV